MNHETLNLADELYTRYKGVEFLLNCVATAEDEAHFQYLPDVLFALEYYIRRINDDLYNRMEKGGKS